MANIVIVDDIPQMQELLARIVCSFGHNVKTCANGIQVLTLLEYFQCDLIFLDMNLKEERGVEICRKIKKNKHWANIPICFVSAARNRSDIITALAAGGDDYIVKPVSPRIVDEKLSRFFDPKEPINAKQDIVYDVDFLVNVNRIPVQLSLQVNRISNKNMFVSSEYPLKKNGKFEVSIPHRNRQGILPVSCVVDECYMIDEQNFNSKISLLDLSLDFFQSLQLEEEEEFF